MNPMALLIVSFVAGALTILAPCILPLLPVTLGGAMAESGNRRRPLIIVAALSVSVFVFTLLLKGSTALIDVSPTFWSYISAAILGLFGLTLLFPYTWAKFVLRLPGHNKPDSWLAVGYKHRGEWWADILVGAALGPVFTTCSPTFFLIIATVLPQSLGAGLADLLAYILGLALALLAVAYVGQRLVNRLEWATNPTGWFRRVLGALFVLMAVAIAWGFDKQIEASILRAGFFDVTKLEQSIKESLESPVSTSGQTEAQKPGEVADEQDLGPYTEIVGPSGFINSQPFKLADLVGKKIILVDFIDYSCINCERTFPYMVDWYKKYKDKGLEIVAIHTPEFAFEKDIENVRKALVGQFGLTFPIVLDNDYSTWNAYKNSYWPHKYLINLKGRVVYEHIGEGGYDETEREIVHLLGTDMATSTVPAYSIRAASPETYFGAWRNELFGNGAPHVEGNKVYTVPDKIGVNQFYLGGSWHIDKEYIESRAAGAKIVYEFLASKIHLVAQSADGKPVKATIMIDGKQTSTINIAEPRLYDLYLSDTAAGHKIEIIFDKAGVRAFTFTFG